jgi:hypothetical protein
MRCSGTFHSTHGDAAVPVVKNMKTINITAVRNTIFVTLFALVLVKGTGAQELDDIITDRPDQTESAVTVSKGMVQIEIGGTYENDRIPSPELMIPGVSTKNISVPSILVRWGILNNVELRIGSEYTSTKITTDFTTITQPSNNIEHSGIAPITIGTKIKLFEEKGARPDAAFLFSLNIPFKDNDLLHSEYVGTEFRVAMGHTLSERFSLSYNLGGEWDGSSPAATGIYTLALGISLEQKLSMFVESYGFLPQGESPDHRLDGGFTFLFAKNVQADISGGIGITERSPDFFIGGGISIRLPR